MRDTSSGPSTMSHLVEAVKRAFTKISETGSSEGCVRCQSSESCRQDHSSEALVLPRLDGGGYQQLSARGGMTTQVKSASQSLDGGRPIKTSRASAAADMEPRAASPRSPLTRVSLDLAQPVSPASMHVVKKMYQKAQPSTSAAAPQRPQQRASDPGCQQPPDRPQHLLLFASGPSFCPAILEHGDDSRPLDFGSYNLPDSPSLRTGQRCPSSVRRNLFGCEMAESADTSESGHSDALAGVWSDRDGTSSPRPARKARSTQSSPGKLPPSQGQFPRAVSDSGDSLPVDRRSYMKSQKFRQRRLTDSEAVMNLREASSTLDQDLGALARQIGLSIDTTSFPGQPSKDHSVPGPSQSFTGPHPALSARRSHPAVKLRRLRSGNSNFHDETRPVMPIRPVYNLPQPGSNDRSLRKLRSFPAAAEQPKSPCSVLSRATSYSSGYSSESSDSLSARSLLS